MARTVKEEAKKKSVAKDDLRRVQKEADRLKQLAADYSGQHGAYLKNQIEHHGLNRRALANALSVMRLEASEQQAFIRASLDYLHKLGAFDQTDLFDDMLKTLEDIIETIKGAPRPTTPADPTINALVN